MERMESGHGLVPASPGTLLCCRGWGCNRESCSCRCPHLPLTPGLNLPWSPGLNLPVNPGLNLPVSPGFNVVPGSSRRAHACRQPRAPRRSITRRRTGTGTADQFNDCFRCAERARWRRSSAGTSSPGTWWHQEPLIPVACGAKHSQHPRRDACSPLPPGYRGAALPGSLQNCPAAGEGSLGGLVLLDGGVPAPNPPDLTISSLQNPAPGLASPGSPGWSRDFGTGSGGRIVPRVPACTCMCVRACVCGDFKHLIYSIY